jgi:hypothetical protein
MRIGGQGMKTAVMFLCLYNKSNDNISDKEYNIKV